jgi:hypothetical protein
LFGWVAICRRQIESLSQHELYDLFGTVEESRFEM